MSRPINLYWNINNEAIDEAIRKFEALQKKVEEFASKAEKTKDSFTGMDEEQAKALDLEYKRLKIKEQELVIEEKQLKLATQKQKIEEETAKKMEAAVEKKAKAESESRRKEEETKKKIFDKEEKEAQKRIKEAENLARKEQAAQEKIHAKQAAEREKEKRHMQEMIAMRAKQVGSRASSGGGGGGFSMPNMPTMGGGDDGGGLLKMAGAAGALGAALSAAAQAAQVVGQAMMTTYTAVIRAAMETQRLETNLALAYQSASVGGKGFEENLKLAESAMLRLNELAAKTPFDVNQITDAYIKLTKRGMRPAEDQLLAIGNLAAFSGKSIDQLVEAILDAQQGNKVRLKEFGIEMQVEAGKVKLGIGDIQVEGEKIIETFAKLGSMPGISEAMIRQSETLGGIFDTLKDTFLQFLSGIGRAPTFFNTLKTAGAGLAVMMDGLKLAAGKFGEALGEPIRIIVNSLFPKLKTDGKSIGEEINKWALYFTNVSNVIKSFLVPIAELFAKVWDAINTKILQNVEIMSIVQKYINYLSALWSKISEIVSNVLITIVNIVQGIGSSVVETEKQNRALSKTLASFLTILDVVLEITRLMVDLTKSTVLWGKAFSTWFFRGGLFNPQSWRDLDKAIKESNFGETFDRFDKSLSDKSLAEKFKKNLELINKKAEKTLPELPKGQLPGGADLAPTTGGNQDKANKAAQVREKEHNAKIEQEKRRHIEAVIAIEDEAVKNREFNETKSRKLAEEAIIHEQKTFEEQQKFAKAEYEMQRRLTIANIRNGQQQAEDLEFLDSKYKHESEKREFEHGNKMLDLTHKANQAKLTEHLSFVKFSRKIEDNRLEDNLTNLKLSLNRERALINLNAERFYAHQEATNLKLLALDEKQAQAEFETQRQKLRDKLFDNSLYNNLSIEEELETKRQLENLEKNHQDKLLEIQDKGAKSRLAIERDIAAKRKEIAQSIIDDTDKALKSGLGEGFGGAVMNLATMKGNIQKMTEEARKEIAKFRSIATKEANAIADMLEKKLAKDTVKIIANQIGAAASSFVTGLTDILNKIQELRIAHIDKQIQQNNKELEQLREKAELEKERNEELLRRQEIDNKLARQRIDELTQLQTSIPESEQALAKEQIEIQKKRIKDIEQAKKESDEKENARVKQIEAENKRLEEEKIRVQREQFEINRAAQIAQTIIQGAVAAINAFSSLALIPIAGPGLGAAAATAIGVFTAAQVGLIAAQPNPYAKGTLNVEGEEKNKDSVPALLMPGEAVIPVRENKDYHDAVKAIYHREISPADMKMLIKNYKMRRFDMSGASGGSQFIVNQIDSKPIVDAIKEKPVASVNIDENGLELFIEKSGERTKILNKKLRIRT